MANPMIPCRGVHGIPTMRLFDRGSEIARQVGALPAGAIPQCVDEHARSAKART